MPPKADWEKYKPPVDGEEEKEDNVVPLSEGDIQVLKTYVCTLSNCGDSDDEVVLMFRWHQFALVSHIIRRQVDCQNGTILTTGCCSVCRTAQGD